MNAGFRGRHRAVALIVAAVLCTTGVARDAEAQPRRSRFDEPLSLYSVDTVPQRARVTMVGRTRLSGPGPLAVPADVRGTYRLEVTEAGYETQRALLTVPGSGQPLTIAPLTAGQGFGDVARTLAVPGLGQLSSGERVRGWAWLGTTTAAAAAAVIAHFRGEGYDDDADDALDAMRAAATQDLRDQALADAIEAETGAEQARRARGHWLTLAGTLWAASVVDHFFLTPGMGEIETEITDATVHLRPLSRSRALTRSIVPGLGQLYSGRPRAAALAIVGTAGAGFALLTAEHAYDRAVDQLAALDAVYSDPNAAPETVVALRDRVEDQLDRTESRRNTRNVLAFVTLGVWAVNLADAYLGTPATGGEPLFGLTIDTHEPRVAALRASLKIQF